MHDRITLRDSTQDDLDFVFTLNKTNMRKYVEHIRKWDDEVERRDMEAKFTPGTDKIIQFDGKDAGVFRVIENPDSFHLSNIGILPEYQGKGIGTHLMKQLLAKGKRVTLRISKKNPAIEFYKELGFKVTGETDLKFEMST